MALETIYYQVNVESLATYALLGTLAALPRKKLYTPLQIAK